MTGSALAFMKPDYMKPACTERSARMDMDALKREAARRALDYVQGGMRLGLGTGSTARHFVELLGERVRDGLDVIGVPTSEATRADAERCGVKLTTLDETPELDLTIVHQSPDGAATFPYVSPDDWTEVSREQHVGYDFVQFRPTPKG